jgi:hypothetical protein
MESISRLLHSIGIPRFCVLPNRSCPSRINILILTSPTLDVLEVFTESVRVPAAAAAARCAPAAVASGGALGTPRAGQLEPYRADSDGRIRDSDGTEACLPAFALHLSPSLFLAPPPRSVPFCFPAGERESGSRGGR